MIKDWHNDSVITLRDYFAAEAMQAFIVKYGELKGAKGGIPELAYGQADAMLNEREKYND